MNLELWLVRHGETDWNVAGRIQGHLDVPLNSNGVAQARKLASRLAGQHFEAVYSSDLSRALETARMVAARLHGAPDVRVDTGWREQQLGVIQGLTHAEIDARNIRRPQSHLEAYDGAESRAEVVERVREPLEAIFAAHVGGRVLVVSHGATLGATVRLFLGDEAHRLELYGHDNTAITRFSLRAAHRGVLISLNDSAHLERVTFLESEHLNASAEEEESGSNAA
ncbi:MAG: histidine phosphatase family protein [Pleurocapsa sp. SU_196_0]|nr:histidine phosphatase family protein [Pleurocapsa sp. SU_196_0]